MVSDVTVSSISVYRHIAKIEVPISPRYTYDLGKITKNHFKRCKTNHHNSNNSYLEPFLRNHLSIGSQITNISKPITKKLQILGF